MKKETPEVNHKEVARRALHILKSGVISVEEYHTILEADLKMRRDLKMKKRKKTPEESARPSRGTDPITHDTLGNNTFAFTTPNGHVIEYNVDTYVEYIVKTGDFRDPVSRNPLTRSDVCRLSDAANEAKMIFPDLLEIFFNEDYLKEEKTKIADIRGLEVCLGEMVAELLREVESPSKDDSVEFNMSVIFSEFDAPFKRLKSMDIQESYHSLMSWKEYIRGPRLNPTANNRGRLQSTLAFLDGQWTEEDNNLLHELRRKSTN